jgi:hypothetical protein
MVATLILGIVSLVVFVALGVYKPGSSIFS